MAWKTACADPAGKVREAREKNNCAASKPVAIAGADPLTVTFARDDARARTYQAGETSRFAATGADGTVYELEMDAAESEAVTALTLTPVAGCSPAPRGVDAQHGVVIDARRAAAGFAGDAADRPAGRRCAGDHVRLRLRRRRLGVPARAGAVRAIARRGTAAPSAADFNLPPSLRHQLSQQAAAALQRGDAVDPVLCDYYTAVVKPRLKLAETSGNNAQVRPTLVDALGIERARQLTGAGEAPGCTKDLTASLDKVITRLVKEAAARCRAGGGNPFDETVELLTLARTVQLLGVTGPADEYYDVFTLCAPLDVPRPEVQYFSDCYGDFDPAEGSLRARALSVHEERFVGGFVAGRYRPDASVVIDGKLKLVLSSRVNALFTFGCEGADPPQPGEFVNHGGSQDERSVLLPGEGGQGTVSTGDDFAKPGPCDPDCQRATATYSARTADKP